MLHNGSLMNIATRKVLKNQAKKKKTFKNSVGTGKYLN